ncbi:hypothetical protein QR98_0036110 [Sarcoptes scabiei]|uniref:Uncharacterized protein n=1 Tax=Sarcoptes scabiei TaxID=52283 RepID=A0A132A298_SARSC|nr:hypothetical protein QR98_0036110 [Sarcoptes scabiei]
MANLNDYVRLQNGTIERLLHFMCGLNGIPSSHQRHICISILSLLVTLDFVSLFYYLFLISKL